MTLKRPEIHPPQASSDLRPPVNPETETQQRDQGNDGEPACFPDAASSSRKKERCVHISADSANLRLDSCALKILLMSISRGPQAAYGSSQNSVARSSRRLLVCNDARTSFDRPRCVKPHASGINQGKNCSFPPVTDSLLPIPRRF